MPNQLEEELRAVRQTKTILKKKYNDSIAILNAKETEILRELNRGKEDEVGESDETVDG